MTFIAFRFDLFVLRLKFIEFQIAQIFDIDHLVACFINGPYQLVEFEIDCPGISVLGVLDEKDH